MIVSLIILIVLVIILIVLIIFLIKYIKKKRINLIPEDVLMEFNEVERRYLESNGEINPHEVLWEVAKERRERRINRDTGIERRERPPELNEPINRGSELSIPTINRVEQDGTRDNVIERNNAEPSKKRRRIIVRRRRS